MKLNPDCIRDILLYMEDAPYGEEICPDQLFNALPNYSPDEISYAVMKMDEAGFVNASIEKYIDGSAEFVLLDITYSGHQFLSNIRENKIWSGVKSIAGKVGATSLEAFTQIASGVITELIKAHFGLTS